MRTLRDVKKILDGYNDDYLHRIESEAMQLLLHQSDDTNVCRTSQQEFFFSYWFSNNESHGKLRQAECLIFKET